MLPFSFGLSITILNEFKSAYIRPLILKRGSCEDASLNIVKLILKVRTIECEVAVETETLKEDLNILSFSHRMSLKHF